MRRSPQIAPPWPKLTLARLSCRQSGVVEREDECPQPLDHVGGILPGRDQDCLGIARRDDQSLGFRCAVSPQNRPSLAKTDACWLAWQSNWSSSARRRMPTAGTSCRWRFPRTGPRLCRDRATLRSKSGIQVRRSPQIAPPWPKLTLARLSCRQSGVVEREDECPQPLDHVGGILPGRDQDCLGIARRDDQSLGFRCAVSPQNRPSLAKTDACWLAWQSNWSSSARRRMPTAG
mgnify:FL=1